MKKSIKYDTFVQKVSGYPYFKASHLLNLTDDPQVLRNQLCRWAQSGKIHQIKKGMYVLDKPITTKYSALYYSGILHSPSYVSLEKALEFYALIPEAVSLCSCVTSKKTLKIENHLGVFSYHHTRTKLFNHFVFCPDGSGRFSIALPEKAMTDFFYFRLKKVSTDPSIFRDSFRMQNMDQINIPRLIQFASEYQSPRVMQWAKLFEKFWKESKND
jgi:hypothetical protein